MGIDPYSPLAPRPSCTLYPVTYTLFMTQDSGYRLRVGVCFLCGTGIDRYHLEKK